VEIPEVLEVEKLDQEVIPFFMLRVLQDKECMVVVLMMKPVVEVVVEPALLGEILVEAGVVHVLTEELD